MAAKKGVTIDLKATKKSVEQALRELKMAMDADMEALKERRFYTKPAKARREKAKKRRVNIQRYNKHK